MDSGLVVSCLDARSLTTGIYISAFNSLHPLHTFFHFIHFSLVNYLFADKYVETSVIVDGNLWQSKQRTKNIQYASYCPSQTSHQKRRNQIEYNILKFQQPCLNHHYRRIEGWSTYQECNKKYVVKANLKPSFDFEPSDNYIKNFLDIIHKFSYPYAMIGIILGTISSSSLAVEKLSDISLSLFISILQALVTYMFIAIYVAAINQVFDFEIDKINKPYLPLASGQLSLRTVVIIAASSLTLGLGLSWIIGSWPLIWINVLSALIWSIYSFNLPLLRWKSHPLLAAMCGIVSGGIVLPIGFFLHTQTFVLKKPIVFPRSLIASVLFSSLYFTSLALAKDISDIEGDKTYGVDTFAIRLGPKRVFWICVSLFEMAFGVVFLAGVTSPYLWIKIVTGLGYVVLASILWYQAKSIDLSNNYSNRSFYMLIWKLLYAAYFLVALVR